MEIIVYYTSTAVLCTLGLDALFLLSPCCKWSLSYICMCWNDIYCICWCQTVSHTHAHIHSDTGRGKSSHIDAIFSLWSHLWAPNSTQVFVSNCVFVKRHLPHTSVPPVFFIILLTVVTSFTSQKSVVCCQNYYVVVSTNSSMKGFNYIIDQKTTKQKQKQKNLGNICRLSVARFLFCLLLWHLFKIRALSCVRFH